MVAHKLTTFLAVLHQSRRAMGIEELARTNKLTARSVYRWRAALGDDLVFYPSVAFRSLGLVTLHVFIDDPSPVWRSFPYAIRAEWVLIRPGQETLYLHCLVPMEHEAEFLQLLHAAEGTTASRLTCSTSGDCWQVLQDIPTEMPASTSEVWDIVERLPLLIPVIFETVERGDSLPAIWDAVYARLGKRTWEYLPRFARRLATNGKAYVKECFALLNHTGLFRQNLIRYRPFNAVGTPMFLEVEGALNEIITAFEHSPTIDVFPMTEERALLRVISTHALTQHVFSTSSTLPRICSWHFVDTIRNERDPVTPRFAYEILFDPATTEWVFPTDALKQFRGDP